MVSLKVFCICLLFQFACAAPTITFYGFVQVGTHTQKDLIVKHTTENKNSAGPMEIYMNGFQNVDVDKQNQTLDTLKGIIEGAKQLQISGDRNGPTTDSPLQTVKYEEISLTPALKKKDQAVLTLTMAKFVPV